MIQVIELSKRFGTGKQQKMALDKTTWSVQDGMVAGLIGRVGSGKTATLRILTGIQDPSHGKVLLDDQDIVEDSFEARRNLGFVPDSTDQFKGLTGQEYLSFVADIYQVPVDKRKKLMSMYAGRLKLDLYLKERMTSYSKSMFKKTMLLGALLHQPRNLILDNFFSGMDASDTEEVRLILKEYARNNHTVLFTDAKLRTVEHFCDRVIILRSGKVFYEGSVPNLIEKYSEAASLDMIDLLINKGTDKVLGEEEGD